MHDHDSITGPPTTVDVTRSEIFHFVENVRQEDLNSRIAVFEYKISEKIRKPFLVVEDEKKN